MTKPRRPRNPRVVVFEDILKPMRTNIKAMCDTWGGPRHGSIDGRWSVLPADQQHENDPEAWARTERFAATLERQAATLRHVARARQAALLAEQDS